MSERIRNVADLKALREKAQGEMGARGDAAAQRINVHMGTCGIAAGAREVLAALADELARAGIKGVLLKQSGCAGLCSHEPMLTLTDAEGRDYRYGRLDRARVQEIVRQHLVGGHPITQYLIGA